MLKHMITALFSGCLFLNALIFIPQAIKLLKTKSSKDLSLFTFVGFCVTQLSAIAYGITRGDLVLMLGYFLSFLTCGTVTFLIFYFRSRA